jgi:hypothetical protein
LALFCVVAEALMAVPCCSVSAAAADTMITGHPRRVRVAGVGAIAGVLTLGWRCGAALGPAVAGFVYDATGPYAIPFGRRRGGGGELILFHLARGEVEKAIPTLFSSLLPAAGHCASVVARRRLHWPCL